MNDRGVSVLEQYDIEIKNIYRGRGSVICDTDQGRKLLKEVKSSKQRIQFQNDVLNQIRSAGIQKVDNFIKNKDGELITEARDKKKYILKDWFEYRECDVKNEEEICAGAQCLARLHRAMVIENRTDGMEPETETDLRTEYEKHNRELKKVKAFVRKKTQKSEFENCLMGSFDLFYAKGEEALEKIQNSSYDKMIEDSVKMCKICHGDYNHHNILITDQGTVAANFDHCRMGIQISDLTNFIRKILEKCNWDIKTGMAILEAYENERALDRYERENMRIRLSYPEKFWKAANHYYNSNKAWIPEKNIVKLRVLIDQDEEKEKFLSYL